MTSANGKPRSTVQSLATSPGQGGRHRIPLDRKSDMSSPLVYIVIVNYNGAQLTLDCVDSVLNIGYPNFRVIVVDNASTDDSMVHFKAAFTDPRVELLSNDKNEGYAGGNNRGIERALAAGAAYVFVLNNDTVAQRACLQPLVEAMERDEAIGIAGCPIFNIGPDPSANFGQHVSLYTGKTELWSNGERPRETTEVGYICGAAMVLRAATIRRIGMFDPHFFLLCEDADICLRARKAGYKTCLVPGVGVRHLMSHTVNRHRAVHTTCGIRNRAWLIRRHGNLGQRLFFNLFSFSYLYPKVLLGRLVRGELELLKPVLTGIREGHWGYPGDDASLCIAPATVVRG